MLNKKLSKILIIIFEIYKKKYKLNTHLKIMKKYNRGTGYLVENNTIYIDCKQNKSCYKSKQYKDRISYSNFASYLIFILLHEIKHAIDYKNNPHKFLNQHETDEINMLFLDVPYHQLPLEKRADKFAKKEIKKYGKYIKKMSSM